MKTIFICAAFCFSVLFVSQAHAQANFSFSAGLFQFNSFALSSKDSGKGGDLGETYLPLGIQYRTTVGQSWTFAPALHLTHITSLIIPNETPDEGAEKNIALLSFPFSTTLTTWMNGKIGAGFMRYEIDGKGGPIVVNNGGGMATFYKPSQKRVATTSYILLGAEFPLTEWNIDFDLIINGAGSEERRSYNMYLYLSKPFNL